MCIPKRWSVSRGQKGHCVIIHPRISLFCTGTVVIRQHWTQNCKSVVIMKPLLLQTVFPHVMKVNHDAGICQITRMLRPSSQSADSQIEIHCLWPAPRSPSRMHTDVHLHCNLQIPTTCYPRALGADCHFPLHRVEKVKLHATSSWIQVWACLHGVIKFQISGLWFSMSIITSFYYSMLHALHASLCIPNAIYRYSQPWLMRQDGADVFSQGPRPNLKPLIGSCVHGI